MYSHSARFYDNLYAFRDYTSAADEILTLVGERAPEAKTLLDVGCGTGRHLEAFSSHFRVEGLDLNADLLAVARGRLPGVPLHELDMTRFELHRHFDVIICLFSSIGYVKSLMNMRMAVDRMARHLAPGGVIVIEPWFTPERFWTDTITANFVDEPELKIAWMYVSKRRDRLSILDIHYMVATREGVEEFSEIHEIGLFTEEEYLDAMTSAGLTGAHFRDGFSGRGLYVGQRPE